MHCGYHFSRSPCCPEIRPKRQAKSCLFICFGLAYYCYEFKDLRLVTDNISLAELNRLAGELYGDMVKAVVDVAREIMVVGGELHADEEAMLLEDGSEPNNLWGINIYPGKQEDEFIEFDSLINIRPRMGNRSRGVEDADTRKKIIEIVNNLLEQQ
jgi:hypothetical protein